CAPQAWKSIYYYLPRAAATLFGPSEIALRLPSILLMGLMLFLIARLAARLIHPQAGWFAVFACLTLRGINYEAADARPYALGMCIAAAALLFLVRWCDRLRWRDGLLFVLFAAPLSRVLECDHPEMAGSPGTATLILGCGIFALVVLFIASRITGSSVFVPRYLAISLPGAALAATLAASRWIPPDRWKPLALALVA